MNAEQFITEKYESNNWGLYPPSRRLVTQWLQEYADQQLILHGVVKSLPIKKGTMSFSEWKEFVKIKKNNCGGYEWEGSSYTAYSIEMMYKNYTM